MTQAESKYHKYRILKVTYKDSKGMDTSCFSLQSKRRGFIFDWFDIHWSTFESCEKQMNLLIKEDNADPINVTYSKDY